MGISVRDKTTGQFHEMAGVPVIDAVLSNSSRNAIANKAVYNALLGKVEKTVNDLVNYYNKSQSYSKDEVDALVGSVRTMTMQVVSVLPSTDISTTTLYLLGPDADNHYDEYVYIDDAWVLIGNTELSLEGYATENYVDLAIADFLTETEINTMFANYYTKSEVDQIVESIGGPIDDELSLTSKHAVQNKVITAALDEKLDASDIGVANGVAELDENGKVPSSQLPSYVDDVIEGYLFDSTHFYKEEIIEGYYHDGAFYEDDEYQTPIVPVVGKIYLDIPSSDTYAWDADNSEYVTATPTAIVGESGIIYVSLDTDISYRWSGSVFVEIAGGLTLGETSSTAYRGDRGKTAYDHSQTTSGNPHNVTATDVGLGNVGNFKALSTVAGQDLTLTERANARFNSGIFEGTTQEWTNLSSTDKAKISLVILTDE